MTIDEIIRGVGIAIKAVPADTCPTYHSVAEVVAAVGDALNGCPSQPAVCGGFAGVPCSPDHVCDLRDVTCLLSDLQGNCVPYPEVCPEIFLPVCACGGVTYANDCARLRAEATLAHAGLCP